MVPRGAAVWGDMPKSNAFVMGSGHLGLDWGCLREDRDFSGKQHRRFCSSKASRKMFLMRPCRPETEEVVCHALLVDVARNSHLEQIGGLSHASRKSSMNEINGDSSLLQV